MAMAAAQPPRPAPTMITAIVSMRFGGGKGSGWDAPFRGSDMITGIIVSGSMIWVV